MAPGLKRGSCSRKHTGPLRSIAWDSESHPETKMRLHLCYQMPRINLTVLIIYSFSDFGKRCHCFWLLQVSQHTFVHRTSLGSALWSISHAGRHFRKLHYRTECVWPTFLHPWQRQHPPFGRFRRVLFTFIWPWRQGWGAYPAPFLNQSGCVLVPNLV